MRRVAASLAVVLVSVLAVFGTGLIVPLSEALAEPLDASFSGGAVYQASCPSPRPPVKLQVVAAGEGQIKVTVISGFGFLRTIRFGQLSNSRLIFPGDTQVQGGGNLQTGNFSIKPSDGVTSFTFTVSQLNAQAGNQGIQPITVPLTVVDDCGEWPTFVGAGNQALQSNITIADAQTAEGNSGTKALDFSVKLSAPSSGAITVDYATSDGTAKAGEDYVATNGTLTFNAGETSKTVSVQVKGDQDDENDETFTVTLSNAKGGFITDATATGTIQDDDSKPGAKDDSYTATFGQTLTVNAANGLLKNDTQGSATVQVISFGAGSVGGLSTSNAADSQVGLSGSGSLRVNKDGSFTFTPPNNSVQTFTFQYRISSAAGTSDATVTISFNNTPPTANAQTAGTDANTAKVITLNASDAETCDLTFSIVSGPSHGALGSLGNVGCNSGSPNHDSATVTYTPTTNYSGPDSFTFKVNDGTFDSSTVTVSIAVAALPATHFTVTAPGTATAGAPFNFTVTALDALNNTAVGYGGTVHFTSTDGTAVLPANTTLNNGTGTFSATLKTAGTQTITATDTVSAGITGTSGNITVSAGGATHFTVTTPASATAGSAFSFTVTALDASNNTATGYAGTVHFTSSDGAAALPANSTLTSGVGTFSGTLKTAGAQTITATDTVTNSITGTSNTTTVSPGATDHLAVSAPANATAGSAFSFTVTAQDAFNNTAPTYAGTVHFTSTDGAAVLPANSTLVSGVGNFSATLKTGGTQTITATDTVTAAITGTSNTITVAAAAATHFSVSAPGGATAGVAFNVTVTAQDQFNNTDTGYGGTVHITSTDGAAVLPSDGTLTNGVGTFSVTLATVGVQTVTATDTVTPAITGTSANITVSAGGATHFSVSTPASATAGSAFSFTVTALDAFNNTATGYPGTVHFTSSDGAAVLPANSTLASGVGTFSATLKTAGAQTITATDTVTSSITGTSNTTTVSAGAANHLAVSAPANATAGVAFNFTVTAQDAFNNTATTYAGTVHFTSTDGAAVLPANSTLASGVGNFSATLKTAGAQTITATDTVTAAINGTSNNITVAAAAATHFSVSAPAGATAGGAFSFTVTAQDQFNNTATGYGGTVGFTSTDGLAVLPANSTLTSGVGTFSATLKTLGAQTITATDTVTPAITGTSNTITVSAGAATHFVVSAPGSATAGSSFSFTVTAQDAFNNTATSYAGTVHFTSTDGAAVLPANSTLASGVGNFSATLKTAGTQTITATDTVSAGITGTSNNITVSAAAATHFSVSAPGSATAGSSFSFTVTAQDTFNNTATTYGGTVHFTSTDGAAVLPANTTLTSGTGTFSATLKTAGTQTITATDTVSAGITGTSGNIAVSAAAATHFSVSAPANANANVAFNVTVTAQDQFNNTATTYPGTVHFTSTDGLAVLPANSTLTSGTGTFSVTLKTAGSQTVTATDTVTPAITGTSNSITVTATPPNAVADPPAGDTTNYVANAGTVIHLSAAVGVLANDTTNGGSIVSYGASTGNEQPSIGTATATLHGGFVTLNADGSFDYEAPAVLTAGTDDSFVYKLDNGQQDTATVTITINTGVAFVKDNAAASGNGSIVHPYQLLNNVPGTRPDVGLIYVLSGTGTNASTTGITLKSGEWLEGQGVGLQSGGTAIAANLPPSVVLAANTTVTSLPAVGSTPTLTATSAAANVNVVTLNSNNTLKGFTAGTTASTSGFAIEDGGVSVGTLAVANSVSINTSHGALQLANGGSFAAGSAFSSVTATGNATTVRVNLQSVDGSVDLGSGSLDGVTAGAANVFNVTGGAASVTYSGTIAASAATVRPVSVTNKTGGTVAFKGGVSTTVATANGVLLDNNDGGTGATVTFQGGLALSTGANAAFTATNGGTVNVCNFSNCVATGAVTNTLATTSGVALTVTGTTIGASDLKFHSIASTSATTNGIVLSNTGTSGGLQVTGDGSTAGSGGTITGSGNSGISATNVRSLTLNFMNVTNNGNAVGDDNLTALYSSAGATSSVTLSHVTFTPANATDRNVRIDTTGGSGTLNVNIDHSTFDAPPGSNVTGHENVFVQAINGWTVNPTVATSTFSGARLENFKFNLSGSGQGTANINNNTFDSAAYLTAAGSNVQTGALGNTLVGSSGIALGSSSGGPTLNYTLDTNTVIGYRNIGLSVFLANGNTGNATYSGTVNNNDFGTVAAGVRSGGAQGIGISLNGGGTSYVKITNNRIRHYIDAGMYFTENWGLNGNPNHIAAKHEIWGNTIASPDTNTIGAGSGGLQTDIGLNVGDPTTSCFDIGNTGSTGSATNSLAGSVTVNGATNGAGDFTVIQDTSTVGHIDLPNYNGGVSDNGTAATAYLQPKNNGNGTPSVTPAAAYNAGFRSVALNACH